MTTARQSLYIAVPVFNEEENIPRLMGAFRDLLEEFGAEMDVKFVLVDDGSSDGTSEAAKRLGTGLDISILTHAVNGGPGRAFATAFTHLSSRIGENDWAMTMEGDNTSRHELVRLMLTRARNERYEVALASPYMYGGGITQTSTIRMMLSHIANAFVKELLGLHGLLTMSSFFRLYRGSLLLKLMDRYGPGIVERAGFESMVEMLMKMTYVNAAITEIPMLLDGSRRAGKSKMKVLRTIRGYLTLLKDKGRWRGNA